MLLVKKMANGRSMYVWIGMYAVPVPMFLFVVITASVAFEIGKKKKKSRLSFFSFLIYSDWLLYKLEYGLVYVNKNIHFDVAERDEEIKKRNSTSSKGK